MTGSPPPSPRCGPPRRRPARALAACLAAALLLPLAACEGSGPARPSSPPAAAASAPRDPLADLDRSVWSAVSAPSIMALPIDRGTVDASAWGAAGIDSARIDEARQAVADYVATAYLQPDAFRDTDDAGDKKTVLAATPPAWKDVISTKWGPDSRQFYATELTPEQRIIGSPRAALAWYLTDRDGTRRVELGGTIAYSVIDTRTGQVGFFARRIAASAVPGSTAGAPLSEATFRTVLYGTDTCATTQAQGLIVPAISGDRAARSAEDHTRTNVIDQPVVDRGAIASTDSGPMNVDPETIVTCG